VFSPLAPTPPSPVSKFYLFLRLLVHVSPVQLTAVRGGGAKSYDGDKTWSSINHSKLSGPRYFYCPHLKVHKREKFFVSDFEFFIIL
jgi:hypothetical protein